MMELSLPAGKPRILYVDDEPDNLQSFKALFRREYEVLVADSAQKALEILRKEPVDVLVSDQRMPGMTGVELLECVAEEFPRILRFMLTGFSDYDPLVDAINKGRIQGYFSKPLDPNEIKSRIQEGLETVHMKAKNEQLFEELKKNQAFLNAIIENIPDMIFVKDAENLCFTKFNKAGEDLIGYSREELIGKNDFDLFPEEEALFFTQKDREVLDSGHMLEIPEETIKTRNKGQRILHTKKIPIFDEAGQPRYLLGISEDITEKVALRQKEKKLEAELRQLQKLEAVGTLASGIAHDFNNILSPIIGFTEMALMDLDTSSKVYENLGAVLSAAHRAKELVKQILTICRKSELDLKPLLIQPLVKETLKFLRSSLPASVEIVHNIQDRCAPVMADPTQIQQVIMNLCTNAFHSMGDRGGIIELSLDEVTLSSAELEDMHGLSASRCVRLRVRDTGSGMPEEVLERIFEPYFTTKPKGEGTGLGLSIVLSIVKNCGGTIKVSSEVGKGTVFDIFLPVIEESPLPEASKLPSLSLGKNEHVLLVDDEPQIVEMLGEMLEKLGYKVTSFTDSVEAIAYYQSHPTDFDLVISDHSMPKIAGPELARRILAIRKDAKVIICTGLGDTITPEKALALGIQAVIMKPVSIKDLAAAVGKVLATKPVII